MATFNLGVLNRSTSCMHEAEIFFPIFPNFNTFETKFISDPIVKISFTVYKSFHFWGKIVAFINQSQFPKNMSDKKETRRTAEELALQQQDISVAEFFERNRHLLGFDNK